MSLLMNSELRMAEKLPARVGTIAWRIYRTPVRYSIHFLCNVNNTPPSVSSCCFSITPSSRSESEAGLTNWIHLVLQKSHISILNVKSRTFMCGRSLVSKSVERGFAVAHPAVQWMESGRNSSQFLRWYQSNTFLNFFKQRPSKAFGKDMSSLIFSVNVVNFDSFFGKLLLIPEMRTSMSFVRAMGSSEIVIFSGLELSQKNRAFLQLKILLSTL